MMTSDDKVGGWVKKGQNHDDVILECPLRYIFDCRFPVSNLKKLPDFSLRVLQFMMYLLENNTSGPPLNLIKD